MSARVIKCAASLAASSGGKRVAVVLAGCGVYDGSEIQEAAYALYHLSAAGAEFQCFAPNVDQHHAVDHTSGDEHSHNRNVLVESARIARGDVKPLSELSAGEFDALVVPGGFGAAKNLCNHATVAQGDKAKMKVNKDLARCINEFAEAGKPQGFCCISPVIPAFLLPGVSVTIGKGAELANGDAAWPYSGTSGACENYGAVHVDTDVDEVCVDDARKIVTSSAYMHNGTPSSIFDSVGGMVRGTLNLA